MKNAMQLKALIKKVAQDKKISSQLVLQNYMMERLLERISMSPYRGNFILKGGFLIAAIVGLNARATMDMDATIKGLEVSAASMLQLFETVCDIPLDDGIAFSVKRAEDIRELDEYAGIRLSLEAAYPPMRVPLKIDITTGDKITPAEVELTLPLMLEERSIHVLAYNMETVLAEKLETIISRGDQNTRMRDYYDVFILRQLQWQNIAPGALKEALTATAKKRGSMAVIERYKAIIQTVSDSEVMKRRWSNYQKEFEYAKDVELTDACRIAIEMMDGIWA